MYSRFICIAEKGFITNFNIHAQENMVFNPMQIDTYANELYEIVCISIYALVTKTDK